MYGILLLAKLICVGGRISVSTTDTQRIRFDYPSVMLHTTYKAKYYPFLVAYTPTYPHVFRVCVYIPHLQILYDLLDQYSHNIIPLKNVVTKRIDTILTKRHTKNL